jgi:hypothetical protein
VHSLEDYSNSIINSLDEYLGDLFVVPDHLPEPEPRMQPCCTVQLLIGNSIEEETGGSVSLAEAVKSEYVPRCGS